MEFPQVPHHPGPTLSHTIIYHVLALYFVEIQLNIILC